MVRVKQRYLLVNILYPDALAGKLGVPDFVALNQPTSDALTPQGLVRAIKAEIVALFGDYGAGAVERSLSVKYLSLATSTLILRVTRDHFRLVWAALTFMRAVPAKNGRPCTFRVVRVSGTIRKVEQEAIRRAKLLVLAAEEEMVGKTSTALDALFRDSAALVTNATAGMDEDDDALDADEG